MKILHIVAGVPPGGGVSESVPALCRYLRRLGHDVTLATLDGPMSDAARSAGQAGVRLVRFVPSPWRSFYFSWQMLKELPRLIDEADVVHIHSDWTFPVWWGGHCAVRSKKPLVMSPRGCLDPVRLRHSAWKKRLAGIMDRHYLKKSNVLHATAACERVWIDAYLGAAYDAGVVVIPNGVEIEHGDVSALRLAHEKNGIRTVLYLGRLHPLKGLDVLIEAWAALKRDVNRKPLTVNGCVDTGKRGTNTDALIRVHGVPWQLVIAGPDEQGTLGQLAKQAKMSGLTVSCKSLTVNCVSTIGGEQSADTMEQLTDVTFTGPVYGSEKQRLMASSDVFVLPSRSENFGIVVAEALACGVPVIATKATPWGELENCENALMRKCVNVGMRECENAGRENLAIWQSGSLEQSENHSANAESVSGNQAFRPVRAGWWVDVSVDGLAKALAEAMRLTDEERRAMGENGRKLVEQKYRWETVARQMEEVYEKCVNARMP